METIAPRLEVDRQKVQKVLAQFTMPAEIERVETEYGPDSTGDPSVRLTFHVRNDAHIGQTELDRLTRFLSELTSALLQADIAGFPYTRLEQAS
jgi:hypothetical protein